MKQYIGSQEHWEDSVNADHDKREEIQKDQEDNRTKDFYDEMKKEPMFTEIEYWQKQFELIVNHWYNNETPNMEKMELILTTIRKSHANIQKEINEATTHAKK